MDTNELIEQAKRLLKSIEPDRGEVALFYDIPDNHDGADVWHSDGDLCAHVVDNLGTGAYAKDYAAFFSAAPELVAGLAAEVARLSAALETIAACSDCMGPGCPYCDGDEGHPPSYEARIARRALGRE